MEVLGSLVYLKNLTIWVSEFWIYELFNKIVKLFFSYIVTPLHKQPDRGLV